MSSDSINISYKGKNYEIKKTKDEQKDIKPKDGKDTDKKITVKNYEDGTWNHTVEISEDGTKFEKVAVKWGVGKHFTIWGLLVVGLVLIGYGVWWYLSSQKKETEEETKG